jgi:acetyl esterase/lipase
LVAISYTNREPAGDCYALLEYLSRNDAALGIDGTRIGVMASSGNAPVALSALMRKDHEYLKFAVLSCAVLVDLDGSTGVAEAAKEYGFVNAALAISSRSARRAFVPGGQTSCSY